MANLLQLIRTSFNGGEWTPELWYRFDNPGYVAGNKTMLNWIPKVQGGVSRRPGTIYVYEGVTSATGTCTPIKLQKFQFSIVQGYILEFGQEYIRVYQNGGIVVTSPGVPLVITSPYQATDVFNLKFEQSADNLYIFHPEYAPMILTRTSNTSWTLTDIAFNSSQAAPTTLVSGGGGGGGSYTYTVTAVSSTAIESTQTNSVTTTRGSTLTWTAPTGTAPTSYNVYEKDTGTGTWYSIGAALTPSYTIPTTATRDGSLSPPIAVTVFGSGGDWPGTGSFFQQRLIYSRTDNNPQTLNGSVVGDFYNLQYSSPVQDNDAFDFTIDSTQVNEIKWVISVAYCIIFTSSGEWLMQAGGSNTTITPTSVNIQLQSRWGCCNAKPIVIGNQILFVLGSTKCVRNLTYSLGDNAYIGEDITVDSLHLFEQYGIVEWDYQQFPDSVCWAIRSDGTLLGLTYLYEQKVIAWHRHTTQGQFQSVATLSDNTGQDQVWVVVQRKINGVQHQFIEQFAPRIFTDLDYGSDAVLMDCSQQYSAGTAANTFTGLGHLNTMPVVCLADGNVVPNLTVSSGTITIPNAAKVVSIGLQYNSDLETLDFTRTLFQQGEVAANNRQVVHIDIAARYSREFFVGPSLDLNGGASLLREVPMRTTENYGEATHLFTGVKRAIGMTPNTGPNTPDSSVFIRVQDPVPCTILAITAWVSEGDI